jgi:hypothetical protein
MERVNEPTKLGQSHPNGLLGEETLAKAVEAHYQVDLARLDREWEIERQTYLVTDRNGRRSVPTLWKGMLVTVVGSAFGILWTVVGMGLVIRGPDSGLVAVLLFLLAVMGNGIIVASLGWGMYCHGRVQKYEQALRDYQARRGKVSSGRSQPG